MYTDLFLALQNPQNPRGHPLLAALLYAFCPAAARWWLAGADPSPIFDPIWQARFLALFPPVVAAAITLIIPSMGRIYAANPIFLLPMLLGSRLSYLLSMRMIQAGLSIEASMGLLSKGEGEIRLDRLGRVL